MSPDSFMPYYGNDFEAAVKGYKPDVKWAYLSACWHYWHHTHCRGLKDDDGTLMRICDAEPERWEDIRGIIFNRNPIPGEPVFFALKDGVWQQSRNQEIYRKTKHNYDAKVERIKKARTNKQQILVPDFKPDISDDINDDIKPEAVPIPIVSEIRDKPKPDPEPDPSIEGGIVEAPPVEFVFPPNFPTTLQRALDGAMNTGAPDDFVKTIWETAMSRGGKDAKGQNIVGWPYFVAKEWKYDRNRSGEGKAKSGQYPPSRGQLQLQINALEEQIQTHPCNWNQDNKFRVAKPTPEQKADYDSKKDLLKQVKDKLATMPI